MSGILPANQWFFVVFHVVVVQHGTFKKGLTPEDFAIKKPNQAARAKNGKYPECNSYLRMLAAFSLVMSFHLHAGLESSRQRHFRQPDAAGGILHRGVTRGEMAAVGDDATQGHRRLELGLCPGERTNLSHRPDRWHHRCVGPGLYTHLLESGWREQATWL